MATLFDIDKRLDGIFVINEETAVDKETGEVLDSKVLDELQMERAEKIDNILCFIKNLESDADGYQKEADRQLKRVKAAKNKAESLKNYLSMSLEAGKKFDSAHGSIGWRKSESVNVTVSPEKLPEEYRREKHTVEADKVGLKKALKAGLVIDGVELVETQKIQVK